MALDTLTPGEETGSTSRDKINATITELNKILDFPTAEGTYLMNVDAAGAITWTASARTIQVNDDFGNAISRAEIDSVLAGANITEKGDGFTLIIIDVNSTAWLAKYIAANDKFAVKKMVLK